MNLDLSFYKGKTVLLTGHTGFKGSWLTRILVLAGAKVVGYSLKPPTDPALFDILDLKDQIVSIEGDIADFERLDLAFKQYKPEIVFHLAAQPIVLTSYEQPLYTFRTNCLGTANILEAARLNGGVISFLNVTTDKVYLNNDDPNHSFREDEPLDGFDPYSNSKSCSELITHSYKRSFFDPARIPVSTARAGNVIGGGDFSDDRIIPDAVRAIESGTTLAIRHPASIRPFQHVLEALRIYLLIAKAQCEDFSYAGSYNIGPEKEDCVSAGELIRRFGSYYGPEFRYEEKETPGPKEAGYLRLDCTKLKDTFGWSPLTNIDGALKLTAEWTKVYLKGDKEETRKVTDEQIKGYFPSL